MNTLIKFPGIKSFYSYDEYKKLVIELSEKGRTTGEEQILERVEATKMNAQRMNRIDKQLELNSTIYNVIKKNNKELTWIVLSESWCGDGAQNIPIIAKIASLASNIKLKIILRDENAKIMDSYLTNGSRSIPKLICINSNTGEEMGTWGPQPIEIQKKVKDYKLQHPNVDHEEFVKNLHFWYARDKGVSLQNDFKYLISLWSADH